MSICVEPKTCKILTCNLATQATIGYAPKDIIGHSLFDLSVRKTDLASGVWQAIANCQEILEADIEVRHKYLGLISMRVSSATIWDGECRILCGLAVFRSQSAERKAEEALLHSQAQLRTMACEITLLEARERDRLARGIHDGIGQIISALSFKLSQLRKLLESSGHLGLIDDMASLLNQLSCDTRELTFELSNPLLTLIGLKGAIESFGERRLLENGIALHVKEDGRAPSLPAPIISTLFRIVRELLLNIQKYSRAKNAWVEIGCDSNNLVIGVADDGVGFDADALPGLNRGGGFGLHSSHTQMLAIGGRLIIQSTPDLGTRVAIRLPLPKP